MDAPKRIRVLRESGGIGDVLRVTVAMWALQEQNPEAELWLYAPRGFKSIYDHCGLEFHFVSTPSSGERRRRLAPIDVKMWPYLATPPEVGQFDLEVDLYCPGFRYEVDHWQKTFKNRIQLFCEAAGVWPCYPIPRWYETEEDIAAARGWLCEHGLQGEHLVAVQPHSTDRGRDWPVDRWVSLIQLLHTEGFHAILLDGVRSRCNKLPGVQLTGQPLPLVAGVLRHCSLLIGPDSGLYHLAAAVDTPALGLFASQPGEVMSEFYPFGYHISPQRLEPRMEPCNWPCFWRRLEECRPHGELCKVLQRLEPKEVLARALEILHSIPQKCYRNSSLEILLQRPPASSVCV